MCTSKPKAPAPLPKVEPIEEKEPDLQISAKKSKEKNKKGSNTTGLNRFVIVPGSTGSGANVPE